MDICETMKAKELQIINLDGTEKTWIGGIYMPPMWRGDEGEYFFIRCIRKEDVIGKEVSTVTLHDTNGRYPCRYWTNLPIFWDTHAVVVEAPETLWEYEHFNDVFAHEGIVDDWLAEDAHGFWDDGFTEWGNGEFEEKCEEYVESRKEECREIPFDEWYKQPVITREEWLHR